MVDVLLFSIMRITMWVGSVIIVLFGVVCFWRPSFFGASKSMASDVTREMWKSYTFVPQAAGIPHFVLYYPPEFETVTTRLPWNGTEEIDFAASSSSAPSLRVLVGVDSAAGETFSQWIESTFRQNNSRKFFAVDTDEAFGQVDPGGISNYGIDLGSGFMSLLIGGDATFTSPKYANGQSVVDEMVKSITFENVVSNGAI